jgi:hypothetical protein
MYVYVHACMCVCVCVCVCLRVLIATSFMQPFGNAGVHVSMYVFGGGGVCLLEVDWSHAL